MARRENWSVSELTITKGIKAGKREKLQKVLKFYLSVPAAIVADRYFASAAMHVGTYIVANSGLPGDGLAHNVTCCATSVDGADTKGTLLVTGKDIDGMTITETITPGASTVTVQGLRAFKSVTSIVGSGWVTNGGADTIVIGFGEVLGLPDYIAAAADILMVAFTTALVNAPTATVSTAVLALNTVTVPTGDASKKLRVLYQV